MARFGVLAAAFLLYSSATVWAQVPLHEINVTGHSGLDPVAIASASGLKLNQTAARADFDAASQRLMATGLFTNVSYRYVPKQVGGVDGYALTLNVIEAAATGPVILDFPGFDEAQIWLDLGKFAPLLRPRMPPNGEAESFYKTGLESYFKSRNQSQPVGTLTEGDLGSAMVTTVFRPANLPRIRAINFTGNQLLAAPSLTNVLKSVAFGQEYTERTFRILLENNLRPLYELEAILAVHFEKIDMQNRTPDGVDLLVTVNEGPRWRLGKVSVQGDPQADTLLRAAQFPEGSLASSRVTNGAIMAMTNLLKRDGFLGARFTTNREFHTENTTVNLTLQAARGQQFTFGELKLAGVPEAVRSKVLARFKLASGSPADGIYLDEFVKTALGIVGDSVRSVASGFSPRPDSQVVDFNITFR